MQTNTISLLALIRDGLALISLLILLPLIFASFTADRTPRSFKAQVKRGIGLIVLILCFIDNSKGIFNNRWPALLIIVFVGAVLFASRKIRSNLQR